MKLFRFLLFSIFCGAGSIQAQNLIFNPSFESGCDGFALLRTLRPDTNPSLKFRPLESVVCNAPDGTRALRIANPHAEDFQLHSTIGELREEHPDIRYNLYSGNAEDVMERLDKGILDFGILIQPVDISKYDSVTLPIRDTWGLVMRKDFPLAGKTAITLRDLRFLPLICSRINIRQSTVKNAYAEWFGKSFEKLNIVATYNLIYNAALMVESGIGCALALGGLIDTLGNRELCFRPLEPKLESGLNIVWKKYQVFSKAAELFRDRLLERFSEQEE